MPDAISWSAIDLASLIGIEKPSPMLPDCEPAPVEPSEAIEDGMPMTRPVSSTSAPPLLPGLTAASVWIALVTTAPPSPAEARALSLVVVTGRSRALTMPVVTVPARPSGLPTAMTGEPTLTASESPRVAGVSLSAPFIAMTARSVEGSVPTTVAE